MNLKKYSMWIIIISVVVILFGIFLAVGCEASHTGGLGGMSRASTSIEFGADFYTTSAQATGLAANAIVDLYSIVRLSFGIIFIVSGFYMFIYELRKLAIEKARLQSTENESNEF